jgi:hypothetical protein
MEERSKELETEATEPKNGNTAFGTNIMERKQLNTNSSDHITRKLSFLTLHTAAVGTAWSLLGSPQNGQAALYLFQKHLLLNIL